MRGKIDASLSNELQKVEWGEFKINDLFKVCSSKKIFHANNVTIYSKPDYGNYPYIVRATTNNGQRGYIKAEEFEVNEGNSLSFAQDTFRVFYQKNKFVTGNKVKVLRPRYVFLNYINANFIISAINHSMNKLSWGTGSDVKMIEEIKFQLPIKNNEIDFKFIEKFVAEMEMERVEKIFEYLKTNALENYVLTSEENQIIEKFNSLEWKTYNLEKLFGKATRGKRLKSIDRISGELPFVTAGEADEGISDFIGNNVQIFSKNTITIDMFGSAKYRNYEYGGDDHVAIVHTEKLPMNAAIFVTSAIHKSSHNGQFDYGRNFYAKDADNLDILLPTKEGKIDLDSMVKIISAVHKMVIRDFVLYENKKMEDLKKFINND